MKKPASKLLSLLLSLAMVCALFVPAMAAEGDTAKEEGKIVILHTNDVHCSIDQAVNDDGVITNIGYAGVSAYKAEMEAAYGEGNVTLVDAGDAIQGGPIGTLSKGSYIVDIMNQAGYDIAIPGNHEFDYGMDNFLTLAKEKAQYTYLCSNFTDLATGTPVFDAYKLVTYGDVKVAYVGIDTPESFTKSTPTYFQNEKGEYIYSFSQGNDGKDLYDAVQKAVDAAKAEGADYVVAIGHLGIDEQSSPWMSTEVIANTTGIDVLIDGHSHSTFEQSAKNKAGEDVYMAQTGTKLSNIGKVIIDTKTGEISSELVSGYAEQEPETAAFIKGINDEFETVLAEVVAKTDVALTTLDPKTGKRAVRSAETNLGDLCADAYRVMLDADIAFVNGGGVRADIAAGDITYENIIDVHPFGNEACLIEATGQQILDALEMGSRVAPGENGGFLQVSGLTYVIDTSIASSVVLNDEKEFMKVDGEYRVKDVMVGAEPLDLTKTYTLASHNYMLKSGGDGFVMFKGNKLLKDSVLIDNQVLINYIVDELGGVVGQEYANPAGQGRITLKYVGVEPGKWYVDAARYVMDEGIMSSAGKNGFLPGGTVTRGTVFQTLYNMAGAPAVTGETSFTDVSGKWYAAAAAWAESTGLAVVPANGLFNGDREITRAEIATIIERYATEVADLRAPEGGMAMKEAPDYDTIGSWALEGMSWCYYSGVVTGKSGGRLDPNGTAVRSELAQILLNLSEVPANYVEETVAIEVPAQSGVPAHTINGILTLPADASKDAKAPGIVMLHGTGSNMHEVNGGYDMAAAEMAKQGLATLRFDFMGIGDGNEADYVNYSYTSANIDAKAAADYLAKLDAVDGDKLGVMGWSQGGTNALLAAAKYPDTFKSVVTWAGALDLKTMVGDFDAAAATAAKDGSWTMKFDWRTDLPFGSQWFKDVKNTDVLAQSKKITAPILTINGDKDVVVDPASGKTITDAAKNIRSYNLMVKDCDHTFNMFSGDYTAINTAISATAKYFNDTLTADYMEIPVTVMNGERAVPATVTVPTGNGPFPAVVMNHGHGGSKDENVGFVGIAAALAEEGIMSIRMDFPGCGESTEPFTEENLTNRVSDSNACKDYLVANYPVNKTKLGILGYSMGGRTAATIVGEKNSPYKAMVLLAGAVGDGQTMAENMAGGAENYPAAYETAKTEGKYTITTQYGQVQDLSQKWFDDMVASKPLDGAKNFTGPVLVMYGDQDTVVPADVNKLSLDAYKNATEIVVKDADHGYGFYSDQPAVTEAVEDGISTFFAESFGLATAKKAA